MSNLFNSHAVIPYISNKTKALEGQRLSKITYKVDKATGFKPDSKAVSIPVLGWDEIEPKLNALKGEIVAMVQKHQDALIRGLIEAGEIEIKNDSITLDAVLAYMLESSTGRLTGEDIRNWFTEALRDNLLLAFASKLGISDEVVPSAEQEIKLSKILKGYEDSFAKLASGAASFNEMQKVNMLKALEFAEESDALAIRFTERLTKKSDEDLLMTL